MTAFRWEGEYLAIDVPGGGALFTSRRGGVSQGPFATLNLGRLTDDDPDAVDENRRRACAATGIPWERVRYGRQVHDALVLTNADPGQDSDGQVVTREGEAALVFTADCLPIALAGPGAVAMVHGGWRGLAAGIVANAVQRADFTHAALGPSARGCCYEVGEEVHAHFPGARLGERNLALEQVAREQLEAHGIEVHDCGLCTMCDDRFFSHRRDEGVTGRQGGFAWRA